MVLKVSKMNMEHEDAYEHNDPTLIYTPENIPTQETEDKFNEQFVQGCDCKALCTNENKCTCVEKSGAYYTNGNNHDNYIINITNRNKPIYECNTMCKCYGTLCLNRLVQYGPRKHLKLITCDANNEQCATSNKKIKLDENNTEQPNKRKYDIKGLGLITTEDIKKGNFVCEYAGEIITKAEAIRRHKNNEREALMNYIFCINENFGKNILETYIDPSKFGNIGRYLNHSCRPNCELIPIRVNNTIPKLCIFAANDIEKNCELTFDYGSDANGELLEMNTDQARIRCLCGTTKCRKYLPFSKYLN